MFSLKKKAFHSSRKICDFRVGESREIAASNSEFLIGRDQGITMGFVPYEGYPTVGHVFNAR